MSSFIMLILLHFFIWQTSYLDYFNYFLHVLYKYKAFMSNGWIKKPSSTISSTYNILSSVVGCFPAEPSTRLCALSCATTFLIKWWYFLSFTDDFIRRVSCSSKPQRTPNCDSCNIGNMNGIFTSGARDVRNSKHPLSGRTLQHTGRAAFYISNSGSKADVAKLELKQSINV